MMENDYYVALSESSSSAFSKLDPNDGRPPPAADEDDELELGLSLGTNTLTAGRIKPNHRPPSPSSSVSSSERVSDPTDATAAAAAAPANPPSQVVVGWPPVRASRMLSLFNQAKDGGEVKRREEKRRVGLVKVKMDGDPIGRKVDLNAHQSYKTLAAALEIMFHRPTTAISSSSSAHSIKGSRLLDGSAEFALTYEDKDGDWMLVGDVPWGMFLDTVKRLRIMRTSDANGLAPRFQTSIGGLLGKRSIA